MLKKSAGGITISDLRLYYKVSNQRLIFIKSCRPLILYLGKWMLGKARACPALGRSFRLWLLKNFSLHLFSPISFLHCILPPQASFLASCHVCPFAYPAPFNTLSPPSGLLLIHSLYPPSTPHLHTYKYTKASIHDPGHLIECNALLSFHHGADFIVVYGWINSTVRMRQSRYSSICWRAYRQVSVSSLLWIISQ